MSEQHISIVGAGPMGAYAMERLAGLLSGSRARGRLRVSVFDPTGRFGAGAAHSDTQPSTSYMNRIASQIALGADESNVGAGKLLPPYIRLDFLGWCQKKYAETNDLVFNLGPRDVPRRYLHGLALREMFDRSVEVLEDNGVSVDLYHAAVIDVTAMEAGDAPFCVFGTGGVVVPAHHVLFVTGHSPHRPSPGSLDAMLCEFSERNPSARYVRPAYPLDTQVTEEAIPAGSTVGVLGLGLTAIDVVLHLTEGRGGRFVPSETVGAATALRYIPSGREPASIVAVGRSGLVTTCRPHNAKEADSSLEHNGVFFTLSAVERLRETVGTRAIIGTNRVVSQLDFDKHVFPLIVLEMAYVYYRTLFGSRYGGLMRSRVEKRYRQFLESGSTDRDTGIAYLLQPIQACFDEVAHYFSCSTSGEPSPAELDHFHDSGVVASFLSTVFGPTKASSDAVSPWGHSGNVYDHRFEWKALFDPVTPDADDWHAKLTAFIRRDIAHAHQNNLKNPVKAACDGVWRDLRAELSATVDRGGLVANSHRRFMQKYLRYYNRLSNGSAVEPMQKFLAIAESGLLDLSVGPHPEVQPASSTFQIRGSLTGLTREVSAVVDGRVHAFDPTLDAGPLYPNLLRRGLITRWRNPGETPTDDYYPGGIDLSEAFHPIQADGAVDNRLTFLGVPTEGVVLFQASAARPHVNSYVLNNAAAWAIELVQQIRSSRAKAGR